MIPFSTFFYTFLSSSYSVSSYVVSSSFFVLERTARYLQDPFNNKPTDTPVTAIAHTVEADLRQLLGEFVLHRPAEAETFYRM